MVKRDILLNFEDMWPGFDKQDNFFFRLLSSKYNPVISNRPQILIFGDYGKKHLRYNCTRIHYVSENKRPDFKYCDFSFSFDYDEMNGKNHRLPLYALYMEKNESTFGANHRHFLEGLGSSDAFQVFQRKDKFCCMLVSNPNALERLRFFEYLSAYRQVDSGGRVLNNIGYVVDDKAQFSSRYKFMIAFENSSWPGYTTEKIFEAFAQNCIPIYWGDPLVAREFNSNAFVNVHNYEDFDSVIERIRMIDQDDDLYQAMIQQPKFVDGIVPVSIRPEQVAAKFDEILRPEVLESGHSLGRAMRTRYWCMMDYKHHVAKRLKDRFPIIRRLRGG